jgi:MinD-like ATPase involved in chromosome partitioning or flagellar assembly
MNDNHVALVNGGSPTSVLGGVDPDVVAALERLAKSFPAHADTIMQSGRLAAGLAALQAATGLSGSAMATELSARELASANRPVDVLMSRCMNAIQSRSEATTSDEPARRATPAVGTTADTAVAPVAARGLDDHAGIDPSPSLVAAVTSVTPTPWWSRRKRPPTSVTPPTLAGPDAEVAARTLVGNHYLGVLAAVGGAGASTVSVLLGQVLATCRSDRLVVADAASLPGGVAARSGVRADGALRCLLAAEEQIYGCAEVSRFVSRTPSRLDVAGLGLDDEPVSPEEYRRAAALLARFYDVMVTDVGAGTSSPTATPAIGLADVAVVVTSPTVHGARSVERVLAWLGSAGRNVDADRVLVVVNGTRRRRTVECDALAGGLAGRCAAVTTIPWDPQLASGEAVDLRALHPATLGATTALAAMLVDQLGRDE